MRKNSEMKGFINQLDHKQKKPREMGLKKNQRNISPDDNASLPVIIS